MLPPFDPAQVHVHGPEPATEEADPALHRLLEGAEPKLWPLEEPQAPLIELVVAEKPTLQLATMAPVV